MPRNNGTVIMGEWEGSKFGIPVWRMITRFIITDKETSNSFGGGFLFFFYFIMVATSNCYHHRHSVTVIFGPVLCSVVGARAYDLSNRLVRLSSPVCVFVCTGCMSCEEALCFVDR